MVDIGLKQRMALVIDRVKTQARLAEKTGLSLKTIGVYAAGTAQTKNSTLQRIADGGGVDFAWLATGIGQPEGAEPPFTAIARTLNAEERFDDAAFSADFGRSLAKAGRAPLIPPLVPVLGTVAGSIIGSMALSEDAVEYANRPIGVANVADAYGLRVVGVSMLERFREGELVIVHPHRHIVKGDIIVIQEQLHPASHVSAYIKEFVRNTKDGIETVQYNPRQPVEFKNIRIKSVHRVMTTNELFGL
jgi:phage repressor protein C with HTH and peptisase S24 domain